MQPASRSDHGRTEHVSPEVLASATPVQSSLQQTFEGRSHTEIARLIAKEHGWLMFGDMLLAPDGLVIADTLETAAAGMLALEWFHPSGIAISWHEFESTKRTNAGTLESAVRRIQAAASTSGTLSGSFPPGYLDELRDDWPD